MKGFITKLVVILVFLALDVTAKQSEHQHSLVGSHGMVLFNDHQGQLYASHMPLYYSPHDHQIIYKVKVSPSSKLNALMKQKLVTVLPAKFDLSILLSGDTLTIDTDFYQGHFERGGKLVDKQTLTFVEPVYIRSLQPKLTTEQSLFDLVSISEKQNLYVHRIESKPSFDAIGFAQKQQNIKQTKSCKKAKELSQTDLLAMFRSCGLNQPVYLETQDFQ